VGTDEADDAVGEPGEASSGGGRADRHRDGQPGRILRLQWLQGRLGGDAGDQPVVEDDVAAHGGASGAPVR
jgi:hypothetical protein